MGRWAKVIALFFLVVSIVTLPAKFKDMPINHWAYDAVMYVSNLGIISGYPDGTFRGMDYVSRYQLAVAVYRTIEYIRKNVSGTSVVASPESEGTPADIAKLRQDMEERFKEIENDLEQHKSYIESKVDNVTQKLIQLSVDLANSANKYTELKG
ncbi:MAG: S-layer homology domain-containing protein, partial [Thermotogaceae bacterium]|nr:S-layer homology domain-containing protein [Thermotogaceae bacterium]